MPPAIFNSIAMFQSQLVRLELCLPLMDFQRLNDMGGLFSSVSHLAISLSGSGPALGTTTTFKDTPNLRELYLGKGFSLSNLGMEAGISPFLTKLELSEAMSFQAVLGLAQRFSMLEHLKVCPNTSDLMHLAEPRTMSQLRSLDFGLGSNFYDGVKVPNLQHLGFHLSYAYEDGFHSHIYEHELHSLILRSACLLQHLTLRISFNDTEQLLRCFNAVPSLLTLKVEASGGSSGCIFECITSVSVVPNLRVLTVCTEGPIDYEPAILMASTRRDTALRTIRLRLNSNDDSEESFGDGGWLPSHILWMVIQSPNLDMSVETPDGDWPDSLECAYVPLPSELETDSRQTNAANSLRTCKYCDVGMD
ncbi:hypothetical protein DFH09DRAFT_1342238 [Mycena vulgaris]|nr:hypothetical protein DFH09DRAFT_1342238 [Mycena vulgaris]